MAIDPQDDLVQDFLVESREILEGLSEQLIALEQTPGDKDLLNAVFRGFHTIKGGAGFLSLDELVDVCHTTEDIFNLLRQGEKTMSAELMDNVLQALDVVNGMFAAMENGEDLAAAPESLMATLRRHNAPDSEMPADAGTSPGPAAESAGSGAEGDAGAAADGEISDDEFEALLDALDAEKRAGGAAGTPASEATGAGGRDGDDITDDEFEAILDQLHGDGQHGGTPAADTPDAAQAPADATSGEGGDDIIAEDEFEQLLDELHGSGQAPKAITSPASHRRRAGPTGTDRVASGSRGARPPCVSTPPSSTTS